MRHKGVLAAMAAVVAATSPALAGSLNFGVGVGFGAPVYRWGPPPGYYEPAYPPDYFGPPPVVVEPMQPVLAPNMVPPGAILDALEDVGYRELSPMAHRGALYKLNAVNPAGDLVQLEISVFTGEIERERILAVNRGPGAAPIAPPAPRQSIQPGPGGSAGNDRNPLVIY